MGRCKLGHTLPSQTQSVYCLVIDLCIYVCDTDSHARMSGRTWRAQSLILMHTSKLPTPCFQNSWWEIESPWSANRDTWIAATYESWVNAGECKHISLCALLCCWWIHKTHHGSMNVLILGTTCVWLNISVWNTWMKWCIRNNTRWCALDCGDSSTDLWLPNWSSELVVFGKFLCRKKFLTMVSNTAMWWLVAAFPYTP